MPRGSSKPPLVLSHEERAALERWVRRPTTAQALAQRARIVLRCATGALVLCVEEKAQIQALDRTQPVLPMRPGQVELRTHDCARHGTTTLFAALNAKTGTVISEFHRRQRAREFRKFLDTANAHVPAALAVHLILDSSSTRKTAVIHRCLARHPRFHLHFTPTGSSWINLVDRWFAALTGKAPAPRRPSEYARVGGGHSSPGQDHQRPCQALRVDQAADEILASVARFYPRISNLGH